MPGPFVQFVGMYSSRQPPQVSAGRTRWRGLKAQESAGSVGAMRQTLTH